MTRQQLRGMRHAFTARKQAEQGTLLPQIQLLQPLVRNRLAG